MLVSFSIYHHGPLERKDESGKSKRINTYMGVLDGNTVLHENPSRLLLDCSGLIVHGFHACSSFMRRTGLMLLAASQLSFLTAKITHI